ncbi:M61 family metallopeptidase [Caulobacter sp. 17J65-9]|uniref:M61 family metallopeptidase n=1 Tax=Caulobacter sp. 17J65-9 TaxID=2709382 RepID=UPI0013C67364|nr:M61 family metallopeptidase [Caulobacter sp. 17J65-9]NEX93001.1 M61 family metallopeptidase [Caulobacter sp. 17J65-9]
MSASFRAVLLAAAVLTTSAAARPPETEPVRYQVTPVMQGADLQALEIEIRFRGDADGETRLELPNEWGGETELWRRLTGLTVTGASVAEDGPQARILKHAPGAPLTVRYRVSSGAAADPRAPYRPIVRPGWFSVLGETVFVVPADSAGRSASFRWGRLPRGWTAASDAEHGAMGRPLSVDDVVESVSLGGADVTVQARDIPGGRLRVAARGSRLFTDAELADLAARVIGADRSFWNDTAEPFFVAMTPLEDAAQGSVYRGTGRTDGFALYGTANVDLAAYRYLLAHEHSHTWVPRALGRMPEGAQEPSAYWFSEGFTDFQSYRSLLRSGVWSPEEFVARLNETLAAYAASPVRTAPNTRVVADFWTDYAVEKLPYQRGMLLAWTWDRRLREASGGRLDMDDVLLRMRDGARADGAGATFAPDRFFATYREMSGVDLSADYARYVTDGAAVLLPADLFGACAEIRTETFPAFDRGFDAEKTAAAGNVITGLRADSPAYAAGLREGMKLVKREGGQPGDSRVEYVLRVSDGAGERLIRFQPVGKGEVTRQTVVLAPGLDEAARAACARTMSGA